MIGPLVLARALAAGPRRISADCLTCLRPQKHAVTVPMRLSWDGPVFENFINFMILVNSLFLAAYDYEHRPPGRSKWNDFIEKSG